MTNKSRSPLPLREQPVTAPGTNRDFVTAPGTNRPVCSVPLREQYLDSLVQGNPAHRPDERSGLTRGYLFEEQTLAADHHGDGDEPCDLDQCPTLTPGEAFEAPGIWRAARRATSRPWRDSADWCGECDLSRRVHTASNSANSNRDWGIRSDP
jgi:hypothetical protein